MADTDWNLHSKQLITPTDNDRMLVEPSDETAKAVEVGGFRNWLMSTALFNTLTTTAKNIIGAIEEVKGIADLNTTQLNDLTKVNRKLFRNADMLNGWVNTTDEDYATIRVYEIGKVIFINIYSIRGTDTGQPVLKLPDFCGVNLYCYNNGSMRVDNSYLYVNSTSVENQYLTFIDYRE